MTKNPTKLILIPLTDSPPVRIREDTWPLVGDGAHYSFDGQYDFQSFRTLSVGVRVRRHEDGRVIVYGRYQYDTAYQDEDDCDVKAGRLYKELEDERLVPAIRQVGDELRGEPRIDSAIDEAVRECIASLPARDI